MNKRLETIKKINEINRSYNSKESNYKTSAPILGNSMESRIFASRVNIEKIKSDLINKSGNLELDYKKYIDLYKDMYKKYEKIYDDIEEIGESIKKMIFMKDIEIKNSPFVMSEIKDWNIENDSDLVIYAKDIENYVGEVFEAQIEFKVLNIAHFSIKNLSSFIQTDGISNLQYSQYVNDELTYIYNNHNYYDDENKDKYITYKIKFSFTMNSLNSYIRINLLNLLKNFFNNNGTISRTDLIEGLYDIVADESDKNYFYLDGNKIYFKTGNKYNDKLDDYYINTSNRSVNMKTNFNIFSLNNYVNELTDEEDKVILNEYKFLPKYLMSSSSTYPVIDKNGNIAYYTQGYFQTNDKLPSNYPNEYFLKSDYIYKSYSDNSYIKRYDYNDRQSYYLKEGKCAFGTLEDIRIGKKSYLLTKIMADQNSIFSNPMIKATDYDTWKAKNEANLNYGICPNIHSENIVDNKITCDFEIASHNGRIDIIEVIYRHTLNINDVKIKINDKEYSIKDLENDDYYNQLINESKNNNTVPDVSKPIEDIIGNTVIYILFRNENKSFYDSGTGKISIEFEVNEQNDEYFVYNMISYENVKSSNSKYITFSVQDIYEKYILKDDEISNIKDEKNNFKFVSDSFIAVNSSNGITKERIDFSDYIGNNGVSEIDNGIRVTQNNTFEIDKKFHDIKFMIKNPTLIDKITGASDNIINNTFDSFEEERVVGDINPFNDNYENISLYIGGNNVGYIYPVDITESIQYDSDQNVYDEHIEVKRYPSFTKIRINNISENYNKTITLNRYMMTCKYDDYDNLYYVIRSSNCFNLINEYYNETYTFGGDGNNTVETRGRYLGDIELRIKENESSASLNKDDYIELYVYAFGYNNSGYKTYDRTKSIIYDNINKIKIMYRILKLYTPDAHLFMYFNNKNGDRIQIPINEEILNETQEVEIEIPEELREYSFYFEYVYENGTSSLNQKENHLLIEDLIVTCGDVLKGNNVFVSNRDSGSKLIELNTNKRNNKFSFRCISNVRRNINTIDTKDEATDITVTSDHFSITKDDSGYKIVKPEGAENPEEININLNFVNGSYDKIVFDIRAPYYNTEDDKTLTSVDLLKISMNETVVDYFDSQSCNEEWFTLTYDLDESQSSTDIKITFNNFNQILDESFDYYFIRNIYLINTNNNSIKEKHYIDQKNCEINGNNVEIKHNSIVFKY